MLRRAVGRVKAVADGRELIRGVASRSDRVFILSKVEAIARLEAAHTAMVVLQSGVVHPGCSVTWDSTAIAVARRPAPKLVIVGERGEVVIYLGDGKSVREAIKPAPRLIRNARGIDGYVYACGMRRQVYKRVGEKRWQDLSAPAPSGAEALGFEAIDGYSQDEVYAVGWQGEIWQYDGKRWHARETSTGAVLTSVCCAPGAVYAAGQKGVLLRGRGDAWETVREEGDDIWDLCWFQDELFVATMHGLYTLNKKDLAAVRFGKGSRPTCYSLSVAEGVLWSVGRKDVAAFDGRTWHRY